MSFADGPPARAGYVLDTLLIFGLTALLVAPLFQLEYLKNWASIESTFIADARFLKDHWPHPQWQPLWYGGTRFDYVYPPALRYVTAALSLLLDVSTARAYHLYTAFFYCLGIAGVYWLVRVASGARAMAWVAAAASAWLSPAFLFIADMRRDAALSYFNPTRLHVLIKYGEGPHIVAFSLVPLALAAAYSALTTKRPAALALAAFLSALVVSNNFYGAVTLLILFSILFWALWVTRRDSSMWWRGLAIGALAYGLTAFWLSPSYLRITSANLRIVEAGGKPAHIAVAAAVAIALAAVASRAGRGHPERCYPIFVLGSTVAFVGIVLGEHWFNWKVVGAASRLIPELDLALILFILEAARWLWQRAAHRVARLWIVCAVAFPFFYWHEYPTRTHRIAQPDPEYRRRIEYRLTEWIDRNLPGVRTVATGSVRFWYNAWFDLPQLGGGSEQGVLNQWILPAITEVPAGETGEMSVLWMQAFGVGAVIVHDQTSEEVYHDYPFPKKFEGLLTALYDDGKGNFIYRVPRRHPGLARVVTKTAIESLTPVDGVEPLRAYVDAIEKGPDSPATTAWRGTDALRVETRLEPGQLILVQVSYDPAWRAYSSGGALAIRKDALGQMLIEAPAGEHKIDLIFELPRENFYGRITSAISALIVLGLFVAGFRRRGTNP